MGYQPVTEQDLDRYRSMKEDGVLNMEERGTDDVAPLIELWRDGEPLLTIFCPQINRDMALDAVYFAIPRINADRAIMVMDSHVTNQMVNPSTGEPWKPGEMQQACDQDDACAIGLLTDCLAVSDFRRDGMQGMTTLPYHVDKYARKVHWASDSPYIHEFSEGELSGYVPDVLEQSFAIDPDSVHHPLPDDLIEEGEDEELLVRALQDAYTVLELSRNDYAVAFMTSEKNKDLFEIVQGILTAYQKVTGDVDLISNKDVADA